MSRRILTFSLFEDSKTSGLTPEQEEWIDQCTEGSWTYDSKTGLVHVVRDFDCGGQRLSDFKGVRFGEVSGDFLCYNNQLTTLEGAPRKVGGNFFCSDNPVSGMTLKSIFGIMETGKGYLEATEYIWDEIPVEDQALLYRSEFEWVGIGGLLKILEKGSSEARRIILKFLPPKVLNQEIQKDPAGMIMKLKPVWNEKSFRETRAKLVWPKGYEQEADLLGDLDNVGF